MRAALFREVHAPLYIEEIPAPRITVDQILIRVAACGVCHTDLHYIDHGVPTFKKPPVILGHECSGEIVEIGNQVQNRKIGERVLVPAVLTCGFCRQCRIGRENICENMQMLGNHIHGAFAELLAIPAKDAIPLPDELPLQEASIIADALSTPYHAVKNRARVQPGDKVVVFGCGGVGINVVQMAAATGAIVVAVDIQPQKLELAKKLGAWETIDARQSEAKKTVKKLFQGGADIAIEAIGNPATIEQAFDSLRAGGRLCVVGYTDQTFPFSPARLMFREMEIVGSLGCRPVDYPNIIEMVRAGKIKLSEVVSHRFPLEEINQALQVLRDGTAFRVIVIP